VSLQMLNFIFIGLAYWRFSVVYLVSAKRFKNMIGRNEVDKDVWKIFAFDGIISSLNLILPIAWCSLSLKIEAVGRVGFKTA